MKIYVDQSGKLEYTRKDTAVAFSNKKEKSLLIKAEDKRKIQEIFRQAGKPQIFVYKTFAILIYLLIKDDLAEINTIIIDREYQGQEDLIKNFLLQIMRDHKKFFAKEDIQFDRIGRKNKAHEKVINTYRGKSEPEIFVDYKDVLPHIL